MNKNEFLYPQSSYHGEFTPQKLVFNANLQEFAQRVNYLTNLQTAGKISSIAAFEQITALWIELENSQAELGIS
jgi:hypothetical protein